MKWRAVFLWAALSVGVWFFLVGVSGFFAGALIQQAYGLQDIPLGQASVLVPIVISLGLLPGLAAGFFVAVGLWSMAVRQFPQIEQAKGRFWVSLALYALVVGISAWLALPLFEPYKTYGGLVFVASFLLPRFLAGSLSRQEFAA